MFQKRSHGPRLARFLAVGVATALPGCSSTSPDHEADSPQPDMTSNVALLVLDLQHDFCAPDGRLHGLVAGELERLDLKAFAFAVGATGT